MFKPLLCFVAACTVAAAACAQTYPSRPVRIIVPLAPGGATDIIARLVGQKLGEQLGQPVIVDNRSGGGTIVGTEAMVRAAPDGYTVGVCGIATTIAPAINKAMTFDVARDLAGVATLTSGDNVLLVPGGSAAKTLPQLLSLLKQKGEQANYGSAAVGGSTHMTTELFKMETGTSAVHIPFRGSSPALVELIAGRLDMMFDNIPAALPHIRSGTLRALAVTGPARNASLPDVPTLKESGVDVEVTSWTAICAPAATPRPIVEKLHSELGKALNSPEVRAKLAELGQAPLRMSASELQDRLAGEVARWKKVVGTGKVKLD